MRSKRFGASPAKGAGARVALASALAVLLALSGCGGGSSEEDSAGTAASAAGSAKSTGAEGASSSAAKKGGSGSQSPQAASAGAAGNDESAGVGEGQGKHGPRIAQPKGAREQAPTPEAIANATVADMTLESPVIVASGEEPGHLPAAYSCDGEDSWPAMRWSGVPAGTEELILYAMNMQPVEGKLFVDWAVGGLDPGLEGVEAGRLPEGATVGTNSFGKRGYEICPPPGSGEIYLFAVYALPRALAPPKGFDARELRRTILDVSGNVGLLPAVYSRG
jgi:phosphatidylethanolamine-binding protein (PEBP) family uncharacterized protein